MSKKRAFSASSEILNFENRTIIKEDTDKNVSEGEIQVVDLCPSWDLRTSASWAAGMPAAYEHSLLLVRDLSFIIGGGGDEIFEKNWNFQIANSKVVLKNVLKNENENEENENLYKTKKAPLPEGPNYLRL